MISWYGYELRIVQHNMTKATSVMLDSKNYTQITNSVPTFKAGIQVYFRPAEVNLSADIIFI